MLYNVFQNLPELWDYLVKKKEDETKTKCDKCGTDLHDPERLKTTHEKSTWKCPCKKIGPQGL